MKHLDPHHAIELIEGYRAAEAVSAQRNGRNKRYGLTDERRRERLEDRLMVWAEEKYGMPCANYEDAKFLVQSIEAQ